MKKKISLILVIVILVTSVSFVSASETIKEENRGILEALNIIDDSLFTANGTTRENFAHIMLRFMNMPDEGVCTETRFIDVNANDPNAYAINTMYDMGLMIGYSGYLFKPKQIITYDEAICTVVSCLGYNLFKDNISWPDQRLELAYQFGLLKDLTYIGSNAITENDIIILLNNALFADTVGYENFQDNETALMRFHNAYEIEGVVTANEHTGLAGIDDSVPENSIRIETVNYLTTEDYSEFLGYNVTGLCKEIDGDPTIIYLETNTKTQITEFAGDDVQNVTSNKIEYEIAGEQIKRVSYSETVKVIYNGGAYVGYGRIEDIDFSDTAVKAIDNSRDSVADVLIMTKYEDYYVSNIDAKNYAITDNLNGNRFPSTGININDSSINVYNSAGEIIDFKDIQIGQIASVAASQNNEIIEIYINDKIVSGTLTGINKEEGYKIDSTSYKLSSNFNESNFILNLGITADFYIGKTGKIIAVVLSSGEKAVGVVRNIFLNTEDIKYNSDFIQIKIFTSDGEFIKYDVVEKVRINGKNVKANVSLIELAGVKVNDPILYTVKDNQLKTIETLKSQHTAKKGELRLLAQGDNFRAINKIAVGAAAEVEGRTKIISIPSNPSEGDEAYTTVNYDGYSEQIKNKPYKIFAYGNDDLMIADLIIAYDAAQSVISNNTVEMYCVTNILDELINDDIAATVIYAWEPQNGETKLNITGDLDLTIDKTSTPVANSGISWIKGVDVSELSPGDIIRVAKNSVGDVTKIELVLDYDCVEDPNFDNTNAKLRPLIGLSEYAVYYAGTGKYNEATRIAYSELEAATSDFLQYQTTYYEDNIAWSNNDQTKVTIRSELARISSDRIVVYNSETESCKQISRTELPLYIGKKIVVHVNQNNVQRLFIFE